MISKPHLAYTVAFDPPGGEGCRILAKMLVSSLLRTGFGGDILVFRNSEAPLFLVERKGLEEVYVPSREIHGLEGAEHAWSWKYRARTWVLDWMARNGGEEAWDKVLFLDADCLALRNIDHLLEGDWDLAFHPERGLDLNRKQFNAFLTDEECVRHRRDGVNSGTLAVAAARYREVMEHWERIDQGPTVRERHCRGIKGPTPCETNICGLPAAGRREDVRAIRLNVGGSIGTHRKHFPPAKYRYRGAPCRILHPATCTESDIDTESRHHQCHTMTQITVRQVDDALAQSIREAAKNAGESMNALLLQILRRQFLGTAHPDSEPLEPRNDLRKFRKGWIEDPECEAALRDFGKIDHADWE